MTTKFKIIRDKGKKYMAAIEDSYSYSEKLWILNDDDEKFNFLHYSKKSERNHLNYREESYTQVLEPSKEELKEIKKRWKEVQTAHEIIRQRKVEEAL